MQWKLNVQLSCLCRKDNSAFSLHSSRTSSVNWQAPRFCVRQSLSGLPLSPRSDFTSFHAHSILTSMTASRIFFLHRWSWRYCFPDTAARLSSALWRKVISRHLVLAWNILHWFCTPKTSQDNLGSCCAQSYRKVVTLESEKVWTWICNNSSFALISNELRWTLHIKRKYVTGRISMHKTTCI